MRLSIQGFVLLSALALAVAYYPILNRLSLAFVSPYAKADLVARASAIMIDALLVVSGLLLYRTSQSLLFVAAAAAYLLLRDAMWGRSIGKFCLGLMVIDLQTGRPCGASASARRNCLLLLPGANIVAAFLEAATIVRDPQGQRLGDRFAQTQVVKGLGARDVAKAVQNWWLDFLAHLEGHDGRPRRASAKP
jgi:uncharacterized RDD family membrane protein YckC